MQNGILTSHSRYFFPQLDRKEMRFSSLAFDDSGMYQCIAENHHGVIYANAELRVFGESCFGRRRGTNHCIRDLKVRFWADSLEIVGTYGARCQIVWKVVEKVFLKMVKFELALKICQIRTLDISYECRMCHQCMHERGLWWIIHTLPPQPVLPRLSTTQWRESWQLKTAGWWSNVDPKRLQSPPSLGAKTPSCSPTPPGERVSNEMARFGLSSGLWESHGCVFRQRGCFIMAQFFLCNI